MKLILDIKKRGHSFYAKTLIVHHQLLTGEFFCPWRVVEGWSGTVLQRDGVQFFFFFNTLNTFANCIGEQVTTPVSEETAGVYKLLVESARGMVAEDFPCFDFTDSRLAIDAANGELYFEFYNKAWMIVTDGVGFVLSAKFPPIKPFITL